MSSQSTDGTERMPRLEITIHLDNDDPIGLHSFLRELPCFVCVDGSENFEAIVTESDGSKRDAKKEAIEGNEPQYIDTEADNE